MRRYPGDRRTRTGPLRRCGTHLRWYLRRRQPADPEAGSAVVEFIFLGTLLLVPVVYLILTVGQLQGGSFAVVGAADQAAKVYAVSETVAEGEVRARQAASLALTDFGFDPEAMVLDVRCAPGPCLEPASGVTVTVRLAVPLPLIPSMQGVNLSAATVESAATQLVGRYR